MGSIVKIEVTIGNKFSAIFRAGVKPQKPFALGDGAITIGIPPLGVLTIYVTQKNKLHHRFRTAR